MYQIANGDFSNYDVVYSITDVHGWVYYLGFCKLSEFVSLPDARWHPDVGSLLRNPEFLKVMTVTILDVKPHSQLSYDSFTGFFNSLKPQHERVEKPDKLHGRVTRRIRDIDSRIEYDSAAQVCKEFGIQQASLSRHLNGILKSVGGGMRFEYVDD